MPTQVRSHAKINLGLGIGAPREDGFHGLTTVYQTIELHDLVGVEAVPASATSIRITSNHAGVPLDERNTAWKMVALALESLGRAATVHIHIDKRLPVQGGLGAGSANAVAALIGLEAELRREFGAASDKVFPPNWAAERLKIAEQVGSDVPLFLIGGAVLGTNRGEQVSPLPDLAPLWTVIAVPSVGVPTPQAFRDWDALCAKDGLTFGKSVDKLNELSRVYGSAFAGALGTAGSAGAVKPESGGSLAGPDGSALVHTGLIFRILNDFEQVVLPQYPLLSEIKRTLLAPGTPVEALCASLSGSGSALFGLYQTRGDAEAAVERLTAIEVEAHLTRTLPRAAYWQQMLP